MATIIGLPKLSPTMEEGVLIRWVKKEGDAVSPGDLVAEVETDKANMDFNLEDEGTLLKFLVKEGDTVKLGAPVAILGKPGEDVSALLAEAQKRNGAAAPAAAAAKAVEAPAKPAETPAKPVEVVPVAAPSPAPATSTPATTAKADGGAGSGGALLASPLAKSLAIELGVDLRTIQGSGPGGRIVERDVKAAAAGGPSAGGPQPVARGAEVRGETPEPTAEAVTRPTAMAVRTAALAPADLGDYTDIPASNMRKRIAVRLTEAKRDVPHFYLMRKVDAAELLAFRERLNKLLGDHGKVSVNDLVVKASALALRRMPECNAAWIGDGIRHFHRVHIGVAVAVEDGLVTPVVFDADRKGIGAISAEIRDFAGRARSRQLKGHEITGSTFTISNLGMFGIERFTAILNPPEAGIVAVGAINEVPVVKDGQVVAGKQMMLTMSCDHRVIDGALGARWLGIVVDLLEHPEALAL